VRPSLGDTLRSRLAASGLNALLPLVGAGEVVRLLWLRRSAWSEGAAALVADRAMFAMASAAWVVAGAVATGFAPGVGDRLAPAALAAALAQVAMAAAVAVVARNGKTLAIMQRWGAKLWNRVTDLSSDEGQMASRAAEMDVALQRLFRDPRRLALAALIHVAGRGFMTLEIYLALRALDVPVGLPQVLVLAAVPVALAFLGAAIPSQMGLAEGALAGVTAALGLGAHAGLALVLLQRARQLLFVPVTMILLHGQRPPPSTRSDGQVHPSSSSRWHGRRIES
jgi:uncharacterized membrane protein YbhN (UPF0104 family)